MKNDLDYNFDFEAGFDSGPEIVLPGIDEKIELPARTLFRYAGEVPSLSRNLAQSELRARGYYQPAKAWSDRVWDRMLLPFRLSMAEDKLLEIHSDLNRLNAYCYRHQLPGHRSGYEIAVRKGLNISKKIFAEGHESGEFLDEIKRRDFLQQVVSKAGVDLNVEKFEGEEFADIGGMLALRKAVQSGQQGVVVPTFTAREKIADVLRSAFGFPSQS